MGRTAHKFMKPYYQHAGITIYHGDCREILPQLPKGSVDLLWTDPPYGHGNHQDDLNSRLNEHRGLPDCPIENDTPELMREAVDGMLLAAIPILKNDCCCCCCCCCGGGPRPTFAWVANRMDSHGLQFFHSVIWDKINPGLGWRYRRQHEMVMVAHKTGSKLAWANDDRACPNILRISTDRDREHPNGKPVALVAVFVELHTVEGQMVLDPFAGGGTTLTTAKNMGRRAIGIEIKEEYCEIAAKRLSQEVFDFSEKP
jgi:site-specific DNA-methyltransferase (adenine-specific)